MLQVKVCVGSSCHIRGGATTLKLFKALVETHDLTGMIDLAADLCLDNCMQAPNVVVGETPFGGITPDRAEKFFFEEILPRARACEE